MHCTDSCFQVWGCTAVQGTPGLLGSCTFTRQLPAHSVHVYAESQTFTKTQNKMDPKVLEEVAQPHQLKHVESTGDKSAPVIDPGGH